MRGRFTERDLDDLNQLLSGASEVVPMRAIWEGERDPAVIGLRHDVDDNQGSLETAVAIARWEQRQGYRSTYFLLHSARYWADDLRLGAAVDAIAECGHEVGIHADAIAQALLTGDDPHVILERALNRLRSYGQPIIGMAAHGNALCHRSGFVNDEQFVECSRPECGEPDRFVTWGYRRLKLEPRSLADFGLLYDTHRLPHGRYLSDSGGSWNEPFPGKGDGQLHMLWHPDWWSQAFHPLPLEA